MKRIIALICAVILCVPFLSACSKEESETPSGMKLASSEETDYFMYVPEKWIVDKSTLYTSAYSPAYASKGDGTNISCTAYGIGQNETSVDKWFNTFFESFKELYTDVSEYTETDKKLGGIDGKQYGFSGKLEGKEYDYVIIAVIKGNYIYYITYTSTPEFASSHISDLEDIVTNFKFKK